MAVGTNIGNTYRGQQGTGFATVIGYDPSADLAIAEMEQDAMERDANAEAAKMKRLSESHAKMLEDKPDYWRLHDKEIMGLQEDMLDIGGSLIASGEDPYTSMSDDAITFRKFQDRIATYAKASLELRAEWEDTQKMYKDAVRSGDIENWDEIVQFYDNPSIVDIVNSGGLPPQPRFKKPEVSTFKLAADRVSTWRAGNKDRVMSMDDAIAMAKDMQADETIKEGFGSDDAKFRQIYRDAVAALPEDEQGKYDAKGARKGVDGYTYYMAEYLYGFTDPSTTLEDVFLEKAKKVETSESVKEDGDVTVTSKYVKLSDKELRQVVRAELSAKHGYVERDVESGKYGDPDHDISKNLRAAEEYYFPIFKRNISTAYKRTEDEGAKSSKKQEESRGLWYDAITGKLGRQAQEQAAAQLQGMKYLEGEVIQAFPSLDGETVTMTRKGENEEVIEEVTLPLTGPRESVTALYDESVRSGRKPFEAPEGGFTFEADSGFQFD